MKKTLSATFLVAVVAMSNAQSYFPEHTFSSHDEADQFLSTRSTRALQRLELKPIYKNERPNDIVRLIVVPSFSTIVTYELDLSDSPSISIYNEDTALKLPIEKDSPKLLKLKNLVAKIPSLSLPIKFEEDNIDVLHGTKVVTEIQSDGEYLVFVRHSTRNDKIMRLYRLVEELAASVRIQNQSSHTTPASAPR